jgi:hypothetical protein
MGGRVVYRTALEMRSTATYREFESHPIRQPSLYELRLAGHPTTKT